MIMSAEGHLDAVTALQAGGRALVMKAGLAVGSAELRFRRPRYPCICVHARVRACMRPTTPMHSGRPSLVDPQFSLDQTGNALYPNTRHNTHNTHKTHKTHNTHDTQHTLHTGRDRCLLILDSETANPTKTNT